MTPLLLTVVLIALGAAVALKGATTTFVPLSPNSYSYVRGVPSTVTVDLYIDLGCSSTMDAWPVLTNVVETYKNRVNFLFHVFPLPYHQQAFLLSKAAMTVKYYSGDDAAFTFFDTVFAKQSLIYNSATADQTYNQVVTLIGTWATAGTNVSLTDYTIGMNTNNPVGQTIEMNTRYMWKYSTLHDVFGTPLYFINGLFVSSGLDSEAEWTATLDALLV